MEFKKERGITMPILAVASVIGIGASIGSTIMGMSAANKQKKAMSHMYEANQEAARIEKARHAVMAQRDRVQQVREARIRRAQVISGAGNAGLSLAGGSSGLSGATSSIQSQFGHNLGTLGTMSSFAQQLSLANQRAADAQSQYYKAGAQGEAWQSIFGTVRQVAGGVSSFMGAGSKDSQASMGGGNEFKSIFAGT